MPLHGYAPEHNTAFPCSLLQMRLSSVRFATQEEYPLLRLVPISNTLCIAAKKAKGQSSSKHGCKYKVNI